MKRVWYCPDCGAVSSRWHLGCSVPECSYTGDLRLDVLPPFEPGPIEVFDYDSGLWTRSTAEIVATEITSYDHAQMPHTQFDTKAFRDGHSFDCVEPIARGNQTDMAHSALCRVVMRGPDGRVVYDSQATHDDAGLFAREEAIAHGHAWIEARVQQEQRRLELEDTRRHQLADLTTASQRREDDAKAQRSTLTDAINSERKLRSLLAGEAQNPAVLMEFISGHQWQVVDAPAVSNGKLDADGNKIAAPRTVTVVRDRKPGRGATAVVDGAEPAANDPAPTEDEPPKAGKKRGKKAGK